MRALLQRVREASVTIDAQVTARIGPGLVVFLGVMQGDDAAVVAPLAEKIAQLRIFADAAGKMNRSLCDTGGAALVVSQFTLGADCRTGRRPSFTPAASPAVAEPLYQRFVAALRALGVPVQTGVFAATMHVALVNDGPVTIWLDTAD